MRNPKEALGKVADAINEKRRREIFQIYENTSVFKRLHELRQDGVFKNGAKSNNMRKVATIPFEVDLFFSKVYGDDYYKDPDFFTKRFTEWNVNGDVSPEASADEFAGNRKMIRRMFLDREE